MQVFSSVNNDMENFVYFLILYVFCILQSYSGMRPQELQEAKDVLVVETADMLRVPLFTAEALLRNHGNYVSLVCNVCLKDCFKVLLIVLDRITWGFGHLM